MMNDVTQGMSLMLSDYLQMRLDAKVVIVFADDLSAAPFKQLNAELIYLCKAQTRNLSVVFESEAKREAESGRFNELVDDADIVLLVSQTRSILKKEALQYLKEGKAAKGDFYRIFDYSPELFQKAFLLPKQELHDLNKLIVTAGHSSISMRVTSPSGTDLTILFDNHAYHWTNSSAMFDGLHPAVIPPGEVNTYPKRVEGILICDGAINSSMGLPLNHAILEGESPITINFQDSRVTDFRVKNLFLECFLDRFFQIENANRVGEIGLGTNPGCQTFVGFCSHINERHPGLHIGLGTPTQSASRVDWTCPFHIDLIPAMTTIHFDRTLVFDGKKYLKQNLVELCDSAHMNYPVDTMDVDAL